MRLREIMSLLVIPIFIGVFLGLAIIVGILQPQFRAAGACSPIFGEHGLFGAGYP